MTLGDKIKKATNLIEYGLASYPDIVCACSFGKDSMVLLDLVRRIKADIPVIGVMATTEFKETDEFAVKVSKDWNLNYTEFRYEQDKAISVDPSLCCGKPKVDTFKNALKDVPAWFSGIRRSEGATRAELNYTEDKGGLIKINPILDFTETDIWRYTALYNVPINPKYVEGYRSLGCRYCSAPEEDENEGERAGRWKGTTKQGKECGIHITDLRS